VSGYTQTQIDALKAAAARGVTSVSHDGVTTSFASMAEMRRQISVMQRELDAGTASQPARHVSPAFSKGT